MWGDLGWVKRMSKTLLESEIFAMAIRRSFVKGGILKLVFADGSEVEIDNETGEVVAYSVRD